MQGKKVSNADIFRKVRMADLFQITAAAYLTSSAIHDVDPQTFVWAASILVSLVASKGAN